MSADPARLQMTLSASRPTASSVAIVAKSPITEGTRCSVCGVKAFHKHFGSVQPTCKGCSAFFRRTVVLKKSYKCRRSDQCHLDKGPNKHGCQVCRFRRCLAAGMTMNAIALYSIRAEPCQDSDTLLKRLVNSRNSTFTARFKALLKIHGNDRSIMGSSDTKKTPTSFVKCVHAEWDVVTEYIRNTGICGTDGLHNGFFDRLRDQFFQTWLSTEVAHRNIKYMSFKTDRSYFLDDTYLTLGHDDVTNYYKGYNYLRYPEVVADTSIRTLKKVHEISEKLYHMRIRDEETAACTYLLLLREAKRLDPLHRAEYDAQSRELFLDLKHFYEKNFDDVALRFGDLMLMMEFLWEMKLAGDDLFTMIFVSDVKLTATEDPLPENKINAYMDRHNIGIGSL